MKNRNWPRLLAHIAALIPLALLGWDFLTDNLTANPIQEVTFRTGKAALVLLMLSLACTPINTLTGLKQVMALRRPLGLYGFFYAALHLLIFVGLDYLFDFTLIWQTIVEKWYILLGLSAFLLLLPLAITSTRGWQRRLGRNWRRLHSLVYPAILLAVWHYALVQKSDIREPLVYSAIIVLLLIVRIPAVRTRILALRMPRRQQTVDGRP